MNSDIGWTDTGLLDQLRTQRAAEQAEQTYRQRRAAVHACDTALRLAGDDAKALAADFLEALGITAIPDLPMACGHSRERQNPQRGSGRNACLDCVAEASRSWRHERDERRSPGGQPGARSKRNPYRRRERSAS